MSSVIAETTAERETKLRVVDCDIHPTLAKPDEILPFLSRRWREHAKAYGASVRQAVTDMQSHFRMQPQTSRADSFPPSGGPPGSDVDFMRQQHLDPNGVEYGVLIPLRLGAGSQRNLAYGAALASAVNDWLAEKWFAADPRLRGTIVVTPEDPEAAIAEIEKRAPDRRFVQVMFPPRSSDPIGHKRYRKLLECAAAHDLPLGMHVGGINGAPVCGAGWPSFYIEEHSANAHMMQGVVTSLVFEGVFESIPKLRVLLIEGGFVWSPSLCWRMDRHWARMRDEVPHVRRPPSEYVREHIWYTTQPIDEPARPQHLIEVIEWIGWDRLLFSTDYPHWDYDDPKHTFKTPLDPEHHAMVMHENARAFYGLG